MTVEDLIYLLKQCPQDMPVKVIYNYYEFANRGVACVDIKDICRSDDMVYIEIEEDATI